MSSGNDFTVEDFDQNINYNASAGRSGGAYVSKSSSNNVSMPKISETDVLLAPIYGFETATWSHYY